MRLGWSPSPMPRALAAGTESVAWTGSASGDRPAASGQFGVVFEAGVAAQDGQVGRGLVTGHVGRSKGRRAGRQEDRGDRTEGVGRGSPRRSVELGNLVGRARCRTEMPRSSAGHRGAARRRLRIATVSVYWKAAATRVVAASRTSQTASRKVRSARTRRAARRPRLALAPRAASDIARRPYHGPRPGRRVGAAASPGRRWSAGWRPLDVTVGRPLAVTGWRTVGTCWSHSPSQLAPTRLRSS